MITIDGTSWPVVSKVERTSEMRESDISGLMLDKTYFSDVIGTYMSYDVTLAVPPGQERDYSDLYEVLTQPVGYHTFLVPYGQSTLEISGRVESVKDTLLVVTTARGTTQRWHGVSFTVLSNHPTKTMELGEAIARGFAQLPEVVDIPVGTLYEATTAGWVEVHYDDADLKRY